MTPEQKAAIIYFKADVITANELLAVGEVWTQPVSESREPTFPSPCVASRTAMPTFLSTGELSPTSAISLRHHF
jgi:hypothetical protein